MAEPQQKPKTSWWERSGAIIGAVSAAVGLLVAIVGLPGVVADALGQSRDSKAAELELEDTLARAAARGPRLDASYVFIVPHLNEGWQNGTTDDESGPPDSEEATTIRTFPFVANAVAAQDAGDVPQTCGLGARANVSVASLVLRNRGQSDAEAIQVDGEQLTLGGPVRIREAATGGDDYVEAFRSAAKRVDRVTVRIGKTLGPGEGILVPLWHSASGWKAYDRWCVSSRVAILPRTVRFRDALLGTTKVVPVRRLNDPIILGDGLVGRG